MRCGVKAGGDFSKAKSDICRSETYLVISNPANCVENEFHTGNNCFFGWSPAPPADRF